MKVRTIYLNNFLIIKKASVDFHPGVNVITGETGSGKSLFVSAFNLLLGKRASSDFVGKWGKRGEVSAIMDISENFRIIKELCKRDLLHEDESRIIVRRSIGSRNMCFINDSPVSLQTLKSIMEGSMEISSQFESRELYRRDYQTRILDTLSGSIKLFEEYVKVYEKISSVEGKIKKLASADEPGRRDYLSYQISEIERLDIRPGEDRELESKVSMRENAKKIQDLLAEFSVSMEESSGILETASGLSAELSEYMDSFTDIAKRVESACLDMKDISRYAAQQRTDFDEDIPDESVVDRFDSINTLCMKHAVNSVEELLCHRDSMAKEICKLEKIPFEIKKLQKEAKEIAENLSEKASELHVRRVKAASELDKRLTDYLEQFGMRHVKFRTKVEKVSEAGPTGCDEVKFTINTTGGGDMRSLKALSGGELSRFLLSLKLIDNEQGKILLFDEIDANIGGEVAREAAREIKRNAGSNQVFVVTHFPQTAAVGDRHFVIKKTEGDEVMSVLRNVQGEEREEELARMLGDSGGDEQKLAARKLLGRKM